MKKLITLSICLIALLFSFCSESPFGPEDYDLGKEAEAIAWNLISGKIIYSRFMELEDNQPYDMFFLLDANSRTVRLLKYTQECPGVYNSFSWKKDGSAIAYSYFNMSLMIYCIHLVNTATGADSVLYETEERHQSCPAWSSDGRLAFWVNGMYDNMYMAYGFFIDGKPFYFGVWFDPQQPAWSPDADFLVAGSDNGLYRISTSDPADIYQLYITTGDSTNSVELFDADYSHDGMKIAFSKRIFYPTNTSEAEIWVINADGSEPRQITKGYTDGNLRWSPDDNYIAFIRFGADIYTQFMLVNVTTGEEYVLNENGAAKFDWLP